MKLEGNNLIKIQKFWDAILSALCQSLSKKRTGYHKNHSDQIITTSLNLSSHKKHIPKSPHQNKNMRHSQYHSKLIRSKITPSPHKKHQNHVKLFTYMNNDNSFDLLISVVFSRSPQLGRLGPKAQDLVISFCLDEGEAIPQFHLRDL